MGVGVGLVVAHPRVCGENTVSGAVDGIKNGSSPRVRGKPAVVKNGGSAKGLIPACAGKTLPVRDVG